MNALERPPASLSSFPVPGVEAMRDNKLHATFTAVDDAVAQPDGAQERSSGAGGGETTIRGSRRRESSGMVESWRMQSVTLKKTRKAERDKRGRSQSRVKRAAGW